MFICNYNKKNFRKGLRWLGIFIIFAHPFDIYRIETPAINISIFRVATLFLFALFLIYIKHEGIRLRKNLLVVWLLFVVGALFSYAISSNLSLALPELLRLSLLAGLVLVFSNIYQSKKEIRYTLSVLLLTITIYMAFAMYTYIYVFTTGGPMAELPLISFIPFEIAGSGHLFVTHPVARIGGVLVPRLALPNTSPPHLSITYTLFLLISFGFLTMSQGPRNRIKYSVFLVFSVFGLLATVSRSGLLAAVIGIFFMLTLLYLYGFLVKRQIAFLLVPIVCFAILLIIAAPMEPILNRLTTVGDSIQGHIKTRRQAIYLAFRNTRTALFGVGLNNYGMYFGTHSHSPYMTVLAERGIVGSLFYWPMFYVPIVLMVRELHHAASTHDKIIAITLTTAALSFTIGSLFYEFIYTYPIWFVLGLIFAQLNKG